MLRTRRALAVCELTVAGLALTATPALAAHDESTVSTGDYQGS